MSLSSAAKSNAPEYLTSSFSPLLDHTQLPLESLTWWLMLCPSSADTGGAGGAGGGGLLSRRAGVGRERDGDAWRRGEECGAAGGAGRPVGAGRAGGAICPTPSDAIRRSACE